MTARSSNHYQKGLKKGALSRRPFFISEFFLADGSGKLDDRIKPCGDNDYRVLTLIVLHPIISNG